MTRDDIIRMALEANFRRDNKGLYGTHESDITPLLERFAALVAAEKGKEIAGLIDALESVLPFVATQSVGCHGYKCREAWCWSCYGEEDAQKAAEQGADAASKALAVIRAIRARGEK